jgi:hypothetical protein
MSKKKSLGSSPVGLKSKNSSMGFIPDLGVSKSKEKPQKSSLLSEKKRQSEEFQNLNKKKKKIVSYNLEVDLINRIKTIANQKEMYYSSFVGKALRSWIAENSGS